MSEEQKTIQDRIIEAADNQLEEILKTNTFGEKIDAVYKIMDIRKDAKKEKESGNMRYNRYNEYNEYGRYDDYNRRGVDRKYRGGEHLDRMYNNYNNYEYGREEYNRGNYNAKGDTLKSLEYMLESVADFFMMLKSEANSQEEMQLIREYTKRISEM